MADLQQAETYKASFSSQPPATLRAETLLACYETWWNDQQRAAWEAKNSGSTRASITASLNFQRQYFSYYQAEQVRDLLCEWDELANRETHPNILAYILASLSIDTQEFRRAAEFLSFESESLLNQIWGKRLKEIDDANERKTPPLPPIDRSHIEQSDPACSIGLGQAIWQPVDRRHLEISRPRPVPDRGTGAIRSILAPHRLRSDRESGCRLES